MKNSTQCHLVLFLLALCSFNSQILRSNKINDSCFKRESYEEAVDIGSAEDSVWICSKDGKVKFNGHSANHHIARLSITEEAPFKTCLKLDVDYLGLPWTIDSEGNVYRLQNIALNSAKWIKVHESGNGKAIDVGCGQHNETPCYIFTDKNAILSYDGKSFVNSVFKSSKPLVSLDVFIGIDGERILGIQNDGKAVEITKLGTEKPLGIVAKDLSVSFKNQIYVINNYGIFIKTRCSNGFYKISDIIAEKIAAGKQIWLTGIDKWIYRGSKLSAVRECNN